MGGMPIDCFYHVYAERKDCNPLVVEYQGDGWEDYPDKDYKDPNKTEFKVKWQWFKGMKHQKDGMCVEDYELMDCHFNEILKYYAFNGDTVFLNIQLTVSYSPFICLK